MRNSLIFKLMGAFLLVIAIGALVISWLVSQATRSAFNLYTTRNGQAWAQRLAPVLADFYSRDGSWQGVDVVLQSGLSSLNPSGGMGYGNGQGQGRGMGFGRGSTGSSMGGMMAQRMILADGQGVVISDTQDELNGKQLSSAEMKNGTPVIVNDNLVGTLIVTPNDFAGPATPAGEFLASVNQSIITAIIIASIIALILGAVLFLQITAPLRQLKKASVAIAGGDLSQRVTIHSRDELGELGQAFNHMAESLADAETQRQHLVADVAHELRTPLAAIQATAEGMLDGVLPLDEEQVASIHTETLLLNRLIGDLRLLSLAEAGQLKLERQEINLGGLVSQVVERSKPQAMQKDITLGVEVQNNLPPVWIDSDRITQVLNNLIGNALRYTPKDGTITVGVAPAPGLTNTVQVSVANTGPGIDPEALPFVFDRFYRSDKSRSRASGGSGLGLAIVKQLVEAHGGKVEAVSPVFRSADHQEYGTRISFTLPNA
jgi:two-component system OmpR family sensor kinase/two-component system sensor histidine kinase BaeS